MSIKMSEEGQESVLTLFWALKCQDSSLIQLKKEV